MKKELQPIQIFDIFASLIVLMGLFLIPLTDFGWLLYSFGCLCYVLITRNKKLWGGVFLNLVAMFIGIFNYLKG